MTAITNYDGMGGGGLSVGQCGLDGKANSFARFEREGMGIFGAPAILRAHVDAQEVEGDVAFTDAHDGAKAWADPNTTASRKAADDEDARKGFKIFDYGTEVLQALARTGETRHRGNDLGGDTKANTDPKGADKAV